MGVTKSLVKEDWLVRVVCEFLPRSKYNATKRRACHAKLLDGLKLCSTSERTEKMPETGRTHSL